jgi:AcrR family transcriptional regulator
VARRGRRPLGGPDTREAILSAARELFADRGYQATTMRAVGARAGVDPALIHHYFGTKDGLLQAALVLPVDPVELLAGVAADPARTGEQVVLRILRLWDDPAVQHRMVGLLRVGLSHPHTVDVLRDMLGRTVLVALVGHAAPDAAPLRAALVGSQIGGLLLGRYLVGVPPLAQASVDELAAAVGPTVQRYLTEPLDLPP